MKLQTFQTIGEVVLPDGVVLTVQRHNLIVRVGVESGGIFLYHNPHGPARMTAMTVRDTEVVVNVLREGRRWMTYSGDYFLFNNNMSFPTLYSCLRIYDTPIGSTMSILTAILGNRELVIDRRRAILWCGMYMMGLDAATVSALEASMELIR